MFLFSQSVTPAVRTHLDAQVAFLNDMSKSWSRSFQNIVEANLQLGQTLLEETNIAGQQLLTSNRPTDIISATAARAQPTAEKLRAYQQHLSRVVADSQVEQARVAQQHVQETSRTASALAEEVARVATEETQNSIRTQQENLKNFRSPFEHGGSNGEAYRGNLQSGADGRDASTSGNVQGGLHGNQQGSQQGKSSAKPG